MSVYHLKRLSRPDTLRLINPKLLLRLLRPYRGFFAGQGMEFSAGQAGAKLDLQRLGDILADPEPSPPRQLADALYYINELSTPEGMDALLPVVQDKRQLSFLTGLESPADVAVRAWIKDPAIVQRKHAEIFAAKPRRFEYYQSYTDPPPPVPELTAQLLGKIEKYLDDAYTAKGRGRGARITPFQYDQDHLFIVRHGDPNRREGALEGEKETSVFYRPLKFDVVGYSALSGTLRVNARTKWENSLYRNAFGRFLFGAIDHFPQERLYTLEPLRQEGCLACADAAPIKVVNVTELQLRWPGAYGECQTHRAPDVLAAIRHRKAEIPFNAHIESASFAVFVFGQDNPMRVTLVPPNIARFTHDGETQLIEHWLSLRGFMLRKVGKTNGEQALSLLQNH